MSRVLYIDRAYLIHVLTVSDKRSVVTQAWPGKMKRRCDLIVGYFITRHDCVTSSISARLSRTPL